MECVIHAHTNVQHVERLQRVVEHAPQVHKEQEFQIVIVQQAILILASLFVLHALVLHAVHAKVLNIIQIVQ